MNLKQPRITSLYESLLNTGSGFVLSLICQWLVLVLVMGLPMTWQLNLGFALVMTVVSVARGYLWRRFFEARRISFSLSPFLFAVIAERQRQIDVEGYDAAHDEDHADGECARAGAAYLIAGSIVGRDREVLPRVNDNPRHVWPANEIKHVWPWDWEFWKPQDRKRDLVRGCALGLAEGEKLERKKRSRPSRQAVAPAPHDPHAIEKSRSEQGGAP